LEIEEVSFRGSALRLEDRPGEWFPHVAVAGRSNVGKSSLLNWLFQRSLARVAKAPGKTRTLNYFLINRSFYLVDLPGYGYAKVSRQMREEWGREVGRYIASESRLAGVVSLVDIRHGLTARDRDLQNLLLTTDLEPLVVLTKADKARPAELERALAATQKELSAHPAAHPFIIATSARTGAGIEEMRARIATLAELTGMR